MVAKYAKTGGVPLPEAVTPHTLRHTFCTRMAHAGMNPKALQYIMGHASIRMTLDYYAHTGLGIGDGRDETARGVATGVYRTTRFTTRRRRDLRVFGRT